MILQISNSSAAAYMAAQRLGGQKLSWLPTAATDSRNLGKLLDAPMLESVTYADIDQAIRELVDLVGLKQAVENPSRLIPNRLHGGDRESLTSFVTKIAAELALDVQIALSIGEGFESNDTSRCWHATSRSSKIVAQVLVPSDLPPFGSQALSGHIIHIKVAYDCTRHPESFVACVAHELSHILLKSLGSPHWNNELYVDLTPMLLGFVDICSRGRGVKESSRGLTRHVTYGYLTDDQFEYAYEQIQLLFVDLRLVKIRIGEERRKCRSRDAQFSAHVMAAKTILEDLTLNPRKRMRKRDALSVRTFFLSSYWDEIDRFLAGAKQWDSLVDSALRNDAYNTAMSFATLAGIHRGLTCRNSELQRRMIEIKKDLRVLKRNCGLIWRIRIASGLHRGLNGR